ncbi:hypothetical protein GS597_09055 [Synechococcales cyanobacterium C]|uniref:Uncharacterized protein n=1 Tax=Petrachloros mirabilis ULC683 TaxID=2781853 RepID=A0A8K2A860_9CYAN|nr:hypothetical protein [Petrachloros mirabilis]NCJ06650.1 hypothetical protein [Petrachloros mirabilis ULC683]
MSDQILDNPAIREVYCHLERTYGQKVARRYLQIMRTPEPASVGIKIRGRVDEGAVRLRWRGQVIALLGQRRKLSSAKIKECLSVPPQESRRFSSLLQWLVRTGEICSEPHPTHRSWNLYFLPEEAADER